MTLCRRLKTSIDLRAGHHHDESLILFTVGCIKTVFSFLAFGCPLSRRLLLCIVFNSGVSVNDVNKD